MPRANRRRADARGLDIERALGGLTHTERHGDGDWCVRRVSGSREPRTYRCPGCRQSFDGAQPHTVAWPARTLAGFGGVPDRRHWHTACWRARSRRGGPIR